MPGLRVKIMWAYTCIHFFLFISTHLQFDHTCLMKQESQAYKSLRFDLLTSWPNRDRESLWTLITVEGGASVCRTHQLADKKKNLYYHWTDFHQGGMSSGKQVFSAWGIHTRSHKQHNIETRKVFCFCLHLWSQLAEEQLERAATISESKEASRTLR